MSRTPSSKATSRPMWRSTSLMMCTSEMSGTLWMRDGLCAITTAAMSLRTEFLAPPAFTEPSSRLPPSITNLSKTLRPPIEMIVEGIRRDPFYPKGLKAKTSKSFQGEADRGGALARNLGRLALHDLLLDLLEAEVVLAGALVEGAEDELDLHLELGDDHVLERVHAPIGLLELLAQAAQARLDVRALDHDVDDLLELARGGVDAGADPRDGVAAPELGLQRCLGLPDHRYGHAHDVSAEDVYEHFAFGSKGNRFHHGLAFDSLGERERLLGVGGGALQAHGELHGLVDDRQELPQERVSLLLQQVHALLRELDLLPPEEQLAPGRVYFFSHVLSLGGFLDGFFCLFHFLGGLRAGGLVGGLRRFFLGDLAGVILLDVLDLDPLELVRRQQRQQVPADLEGLLDVAVLVALVEELLLELVRELQVQPVGLGERLLADDGDQPSQVDALGVEGVELVRDAPVIGPGLILADALVHQAREARQHVDRREDALAVQASREDDLALGDVPGEVGDRVRDVVVGHGEDRHLGDGALPALDPARALVQAREVGVHVSGIAAPSGNLLAGRGDLAQGLAVVRHVGQDDQHLHVVLERQELGHGERAPRGDDALDRRVLGQVHEEADPLQRARLGEGGLEERCFAAGDAHGAEHDGELLTGDDLGVLHDLRRDLVARQARTAEDRELLPADQGVQAVDGADAGLDEVVGVIAGVRVDGRAADLELLLGEHFAAAVYRLSQPVQDPAQQADRDAELDDLALKPDLAIAHVQAVGCPEDLDHRKVTVELDDLPLADPAVGRLYLDHLTERYPADLPHEDQGARDVVDGPVLCLD